MTRTGKIARLPQSIRETLNRRISGGESGRALIKWLNALPEAQAMLASDFDGLPISDKNFHQWKQGGYRDWLTHQEALQQAADLAGAAGGLARAAGGRMSDHLAALLTARYAAEFSKWSGRDDPKLLARIRILRAFCQDIVELRRGDHDAARIRIEETRLNHETEKFESDIVEYFRRWIEFPKIRQAIETGTKTRGKI